ncbi:MAG: hypothetical protein ACM3YM_06240 [Sphingomonadales bacterium]
MSKKKDKKGKSKNAKAVKLPKSIAGVPIGKELRHAVEPVLSWAHHPLVSDTLTAALLAGATVLADGKGRADRGKAAAGAGAAAGAAASGAGKGAAPIGLALAIAAGEIASRIVAAYEESSAAGKSASGKAKKGE